MNLENLELNKQYKYKDICTLLEEPIKTGKSKQLQIKDWERYFTYSKDKTKFIITEIYEEPKCKVSNRGKSENSRGHNNKYAQYTDILVENFLYKIQERKHESIIYITNNCLAQEIKMINFNYRTCENNREKFHRYVYINHPYTPVSAERDTFYYIHSKIKPALIGSLNRLQKQNKLTYELTYLIYKNNEVTPMAYMDINFVKETENKLLEKMHITKEKIPKEDEITFQKMMMNHELKTKFYTELNDKVMSYFEAKEYPIDGFWQGYRIIINEVKECKDAKKLEMELNKNFIEDITASIEKSRDKIREKYEHWIGDPYYEYKWEKEKMGLQYEFGYKFVIKVLLSYKAFNIVKTIEEMESYEKLQKGNEKLF